MIVDDPVIYSPEGRGLRCSEVVAMQGGWSNITAEQAAQLSEVGCIQPFIENQDLYAGYSVDESSGSAYRGVEPEPGFVSQSDPLIAPQTQYRGPTLTADTPVSEELMNFGAIGDPIDIQLLSNIPEWTGPDTGFTTSPGGQNDALQTIQGILNQVGGMIPFMQKDQIEAGITAVAGQRCFTSKKSKRRRIKLVRGMDGQLHPVIYCAKPVMNPLNAHALRRAAVRLGRFHAIAGTIEKMVQKACRKGIGRGRIRSASSSCFPKKRGCK